MLRGDDLIKITELFDQYTEKLKEIFVTKEEFKVLKDNQTRILDIVLCIREELNTG